MPKRNNFGILEFIHKYEIMRHFLSLLILLSSCLHVVQAQTIAWEQWDLQRCIDHAIEHNINIKQQETNLQYYENQLKQSKYNRLPGINSSLSNRFSLGRSLQSDNTYADYNSNVSSGSINADLTLWNGLSVTRSIRKADFDLKAGLQDMQKAKDDIIMSVAASYLQILFDEELLQVAKDQMEVTRLQINSTKKLIESRVAARGSLLEIEAQLAREELNIVNQENQLNLDYLNLYQLLELPEPKRFKIAKPVLPVISANKSLLNSIAVFETAVDLRPEVKSASLKLESSKTQVDIARSNLYPVLSMGFNYNNFYNNKYSDMTGKKVPLSEQLGNNDTYGVGLNLSIPVFNKFQARTNIKNAELQVNAGELELQNTKNILRKEIEQAHSNAVAALKKYMAGTKLVESETEAFRYTQEKFNAGLINPVDYNLSKNNLMKASSELVQAKYDYIFRTKILDFYNGIPIKL